MELLQQQSAIEITDGFEVLQHKNEIITFLDEMCQRLDNYECGVMIKVNSKQDLNKYYLYDFIDSLGDFEFSKMNIYRDEDFLIFRVYGSYDTIFKTYPIDVEMILIPYNDEGHYLNIINTVLNNEPVTLASKQFNKQ